MADKKISQLSSSTTPLAGTEVLPIVQSGSTVKVSVANLTAGRSVAASSVATTGAADFATSSGNVSIGTSGGSQRLLVRSVDNTGSTNIARFESNNTNQAVGIRFGGVYGLGGGLAIGTDGSANVEIFPNTTFRAAFDTAGNFGLGLAPSAWSSGWRAVEVASPGSGLIASTTSGNLTLRANSVLGASGLTYGIDGYAGVYSIQASTGNHVWSISATGLAGGTITPITAATLDNAGNFQIGGTGGGYRLRVTSPDNTGSTVIGRFESNNGNQGVHILYTGFYGSSGAGLEFGANATTKVFEIDTNKNFRIGTAALATTATDGFLYIPTCAGTPTGTPTTFTGLAPLVINTTNNKLYFYSGGAWRDAGP